MSIKHYILRLDKTNNPCKIFKNKQSVKAKKTKKTISCFSFQNFCKMKCSYFFENVTWPHKYQIALIDKHDL